MATFRGFLPEYLNKPHLKYKLTYLDATMITKYDTLVTHADDEEFVVENIYFGDEAVSTTKPKDP